MYWIKTKELDVINNSIQYQPQTAGVASNCVFWLGFGKYFLLTSAKSTPSSVFSFLFLSLHPTHSQRSLYLEMYWAKENTSLISAYYWTGQSVTYYCKSEGIYSIKAQRVDSFGLFFLLRIQSTNTSFKDNRLYWTWLNQSPCGLRPLNNRCGALAGGRTQTGHIFVTAVSLLF